jgi:Transglutaminase-like superfamily
VDWCFGTAVDPQTFHTWIEVDGVPVTDPTKDPIPLSAQIRARNLLERRLT